MTRPPGTDVELLSQSAHCAVVGTSRGGVRELIPLGTASDTPFRIASLTKPVTAVATVLALAKANLTVDTPAIDLLPDLRKSWKGDGHISVADVLAQTSGLSPTVTGADAAQLGDSDTVTTDAARLVVAAGNDRPPGSQWEYYNGNYFLAGAIIAALAARPTKTR